MVGAVAAILSTSAATAQEAPFAAFRTLCAETQAKRAAVLEKADAAGWMPAPDAMLARVKDLTFKVTDARLKSSSAGLLVLMVGHGRMGASPVRSRVCMVGGLPTDGAALKREAALWAGVGPDPKLSRDGGVAYQFLEAADGTHSGGAISQSELMRAIQNGRMRLMFVREDAQGGAYVGYAVPLL